MRVNHVNLTISAVEPKQYPRQGYPEIALVGRSNVGKSALTDVLINRRNYAHISNQPGKTQTLNFYNVEDRLFLVDIPGYGYARVSKAERERWANMIDTYLMGRQPLRGVIMLVDGRRPPTDTDVQMKKWLDYYGIRTLVVLTKMDKLKKSRWNQEIQRTTKRIDLTNSKLLLFSAIKKMGRDAVWQWIRQTIKF